MPPMPKLSEQLTGPIHPERCRSCGADDAGAALDRWLEADELDQFGLRSPVVVLCRTCSDKIIEPHPRLYKRLDHNGPWPGTMRICVGCRHRGGVTCDNPAAKANGGTGVLLTLAKPQVAFVDYRDKKGRRVGRKEVLYPHPPSACQQWEPVPEPSPNREPPIDEPSRVG